MLRLIYSYQSELTSDYLNNPRLIDIAKTYKAFLVNNFVTYIIVIDV
jgi:hypothetical protein